MEKQKRGRPKVLTEEQKAEKQKRWFAARDVRRKIQYHEDPTYREQRQMASRDDFRKRNGVDPSAFRDCRANYDNLDQFGTVRTIVVGGEAEEHLTFTIEELAKVLGGYNKTIIRRWIGKDMLPPPILSVTEVTGSFGRSSGTSEVQVYLEPEVMAIIEVLGPHQAKFAYLRGDHRETIDLLYDAVGVVRTELGI